MSDFNWNEIPKKYKHRYHYPTGEQDILSPLPIPVIEDQSNIKHEQRPPEFVDGGLYVVCDEDGDIWIGRYNKAAERIYLPPFDRDYVLESDVTVIKRLPDDLLDSINED